MAQHRYNRNALESAGITDFEWFEISDEGVSGELRDRPGILLLRQGIERCEWDLIICEDSSRLYRNLVACLDLVGAAVDNKIRVICIGDDVDTAEDDWHERLEDAQKHHTSDNKFTRRRIKRAIDDLWEAGAAVGHLHSGYTRTPSRPASGGEPAEGPFFDTIDPLWLPLVFEVFERVAGLKSTTGNDSKAKIKGEPIWSVARWLTEQRLPRLNNRPGPWSEKEVVSLIQSTIYRGLEFHGKTKSVKKFSTGRSAQEPSPVDEVKQRAMEHLRIVPDWLWFQANEAIKSRSRGKPKKGKENPLAGVPRDSRKPMSRISVCDICAEKMYSDGRNEGGYRCSKAGKGECWNKATALRSVTHENISHAVAAELLPERQHVEVFVQHVAGLFENEAHWQTEEDRLIAKERDLLAKCARLGHIIETKDNVPETLVNLLSQREAEVAAASADIEYWRSRREQRRALPSVDEIIETVNRASQRLLDFDREASMLLERLLVGKIRFVPYQFFGSNKVVLRAEFELNLAPILPDQLTIFLAGSGDCEPEKLLAIKTMKVDLFKPSLVATHALNAHELRRYLRLEEIGELLGLSKRQAHLAAELGTAMRDAGIEDPYVRLTEAPIAGSRWRVHRKHVAH